jgi:hypothetical protein
MESLSVKLGAILAVAGFAIFGYAEVWAEDWRLLGIDDTLIGSYDPDRIVRISKDNATV